MNIQKKAKIMWTDECTLLKQKEIINEKYNYPENINIEKLVFCNVKSVKSSEFYKAQQSGYRAEKIFEVKKIDFDEEYSNLVYDGKMFYIIRTYEVDNENIELTCSSKINQNEAEN